MSEKKAEGKFVDLSKYRGVDVKSFRIISLGGEDVVKAAMRALPKDGEQMSQHLFNIELSRQQYAQAIVEVDGKPVRGACCIASLEWNLRTKQFVARAYNYMNGISDQEDADFTKALEGGAAETATTLESSTPT